MRKLLSKLYVRQLKLTVLGNGDGMVSNAVQLEKLSPNSNFNSLIPNHMFHLYENQIIEQFENKIKWTEFLSAFND